MIKYIKIKLKLLYYTACLVELNVDRQRGRVDDFYYYFFTHYFNIKIIKLKKQLL